MDAEPTVLFDQLPSDFSDGFAVAIEDAAEIILCVARKFASCRDYTINGESKIITHVKPVANCGSEGESET
ncbi:hypothetical protein [Streptomyces canus]|uniref:hypothetical protein n=1 Tax=Streptomyces canus TaxID=58343 RepID=UPI00341A6E7F